MWADTILVIATAAIAALVAVVIANLVMVQRGIEYSIADVPDVNSSDFLRLIAGLIPLKLTDGNHVRLLVNGREAFPAMFDAVRQAKSSITFENYVYWSGDIGQQFADLLAEKSREGVRVHVVLDWIGSQNMDQGALSRMRAAGVEVHRYHPPRMGSMHRLNYRTHRRELIVDGHVGFTGGIGFADQWDGDVESSRSRRDNHYQINGPAVTDMQSVFLDNWLKTSGDVLFGDRYCPEQKPCGNQQVGILRSSPSERTTSGRLMFIMLIAGAQKSIRIEQAYFVPDNHLRAALAEAAQRGVRVELILPSDNIDYGFVRRASRTLWRPLLEAGVEIYEYRPAMLHVKAMIIDDHWVVGGSANFDYRSLYRNDEIYLVVRDKELAAEHSELFQRDKEKSSRITLDQWRSRPMHQKIIDHAAALMRTQL